MLAYVYCRMTRYNCIARKFDFMDRPTSTRDSLEQCHHISCAFGLANGKVSAARPFNRVNGKAALNCLSPCSNNNSGLFSSQLLLTFGTNIVITISTKYVCTKRILYFSIKRSISFKLLTVSNSV